MLKGLIIVMLSARLVLSCAEPHTADDWFLLAVQIQNHRSVLDLGERRFVDDVVNRLTVDADAVPTPAHQKWLLHLKARLKL